MVTWRIYYYYKFFIFVKNIIFKTLLCNDNTLHTFIFKIYNMYGSKLNQTCIVEKKFL